MGPTGDHYSKTFGINRKLALFDVADFSFFVMVYKMIACMNILEGATPTKVKLLFKHCIVWKHFTLEEYNKSLVHVNYVYTKSDRPVPIVQRHFQSDKPIKSSASQMLLLLHIFHS